MPRNCKRRNIGHNVISKFFKPNGIPLHNLEITEIGQDEIEALRLAYIENLNMIQGAQKMGVSAPTFNRILNSGIGKIAQALVYSKAIKIL
ncbi:MAG: DUF134 domain-containing protein [Candidatus Absconditabacteria bacterium]